MKNVRYILFSIIILLIGIFHVEASCTNEELSILKQTADKIKVTYKHLGKVADEEGSYHYNDFEVNIKNISDDLYILTLANTIKLIPERQQIKTTLSSGLWSLNVYSIKCEQKIDEISVLIPRFNEYSLDPLCDGINGDDFPLCGKYYEYDVNYENFKIRVNNYRITHKIEDNKENSKENRLSVLFNKIIDFVVEYRFYLSISLLIILLVLIVFIITGKQRSRGVLE